MFRTPPRFVFYDSQGKIIESLTLCFTCSGYRTLPSGDLSDVFDLPALMELVKELKIPVLKGDGYRELYDQAKAQENDTEDDE